MSSTSLKRNFRNLAELFWHRVTESQDLEAYRYPVNDTWKSLTWKQTGERVRSIAHGLLALGVEREQRLAILSSTRMEWILADFGIVCAGAATTTVYPSSAAEECAYILKDSGSRVVFAEDDSQIAKLRAQKDELGDVMKVVTFDGTADGDWVIGLGDLEEMGRAHAKEHPEALADLAKVIDPENLATLIYTSGTTGMPKGVRLVHDCWTYVGEAASTVSAFQIGDLQYLWLPLSHSMGKALLAWQLCRGFPSAVDGRIPKLIENLPVVRPTVMAAAPRIFEKVYNKVVTGAKDGGAVKYTIFRWAISVGREVSKLRLAGKQPSGLLALKHRLADKLVFSKLKEKFGGRVRYFISGSAPLSQEIAEFFHAADIVILEGYGLTETSAATFVNRPEDYRFGTVGQPLPGTEVRIAEEDGEVLIRGPGVMRGYHNLPEQTAAVLTKDGWLHTGDIGELSPDGFLRITDRKKDLIKTSGGKYIAPQHLEGKFKALCPVVSQIVVHGDRRNFCTALITLEEETILSWAADNDLAGSSYEELTRHEKVRSMIQSYVDQLNQGLASYETIKRFALLPRDLSVEEGDLTPSLKVKRKHVESKYKDVLDSLYQGEISSL